MSSTSWGTLVAHGFKKRGNGARERSVRDDSNEAPEDRSSREGDRAPSLGPLGQRLSMGRELCGLLAEAATCIEPRNPVENSGDARGQQGHP